MTKEEKFSLLVDAVDHCRLCPRLLGRPKVLGRHNGHVDSTVMFVAEAPGRRGADRTGVPLFGDQSGRNFQKLLDSVGWHREDIFVTNAVLCNPRDELGNNDTPQKEELANCSLFLKILIDLVDPQYVVTLGQKALASLSLVEPHDLSLAQHVRKVLLWNNRRVIPLYHPSPRAQIHRPFYQQLEDFYFLRRRVKLRPPERHRVAEPFVFQEAFFDDLRPTKLQQLVLLLLKRMNRISRFKLTKLVYLIDYASLTSRKKLITDAFYVWGPDGPIQTALRDELAKLRGKEIRCTTYARKPHVKLGPRPRFKPNFGEQELEIINRVLEKYESSNESQIKTAAYLTKPMKRLLRARKRGVATSRLPLFSPEDFEASSELTGH